ncbi:MAG TPA: M91 family zinc metallopeptidase [Bacteroidales bacterium]|nr:M91 family zinc metallopeptidase [Bacteroidales bacterium]
MTQEINYTFDFSYDHDWRLTGTTFTMNGISKRLNTLEYNELSQLKAKYFNGTATAYLQRQLYHYNARGWLTSINNPYECPNDVFAMKLYYDNVPTYASSLATGCYNGNIAMIEWFTQNQNTYVNGYGFKYDGLNRLKAGRFFSRFDASAVVEPMPTYYADGIVSGIGSEKEITYDKNGNILTLNRYGHHSGGTVLFDQLSYQYNGNRLMRVIDANPNSFLSGEFCNTAAPNLQNSYDANGNLTFDVDRNMLLFYNDDNLPTNISFSNWAMTNGYRADGVKMSKSMYNAEGRTVLQEEYFGNLVLNFGKPVRILHADGVIELNASLQPTFYYYLKDHLGNIRAVVSPTATNSVHIDQTSEYYPFGMNISKNFTSTSINKYKYNGKEEQEIPGHWLDYGWRMYDPQLGRFHTQDRFVEKYYCFSNYSYGANNPVLMIDVNGDSLWVTHRTGFLGLGGKETLRYEDGNLYNKDGSAYTGKVKGFLSKTVNALDEASSGDAGNNMIDEIQSNAQNVTIVKSNEGNSYEPGTNTVKFDPSSKNGGLNTRGLTERPAFIGLGHELAHALDDVRGTLNLRRIPGQTFTFAEHFSTHLENQMRAEHGLPLRTHYGINPTTGAGIYPLINAGQSLHNGGYNYYGALKATPIRALIPVTTVSPTLMPILKTK